MKSLLDKLINNYPELELKTEQLTTTNRLLLELFKRRIFFDM